MSRHLKTCLASRQPVQRKKTYSTYWISVWGRYYNLPPEIPCFHCGKPATLVCVMRVVEPEGWIGDGYEEDHECDEDYYLPMVNSPRGGECGHTG
jgi:hypothetical protein